MNSAVADRLITAEEFERLPEPSEAIRRELIAGRVVDREGNGIYHGVCAARLAGVLHDFVERHGLGRVAGNEPGFVVRRNPDTVLGPAIAFVSREQMLTGRLPIGIARFVPSLVIEIVSRDDLRRQMPMRLTDYAVFGVARVWVVQPDIETVTVHRPDGSAQTHGVGDTLTSDDAAFEVEGFSLPVSDIFR